MNRTRPLFLVCLFFLVGIFAFNSYADEVTVALPNGGFYTGQMIDGRPHGQGTVKFPTYGTKYVGEFKDGLPNGQGTWTNPDGSNYVGEFKDDKFHGQGTWTNPDGSNYVGGYKDGKRHGQGTFTYHDGAKYVGEWKKRKKWTGTEYDEDGNVTATYSNGNRLKSTSTTPSIRKKKEEKGIFLLIREPEVIQEVGGNK